MEKIFGPGGALSRILPEYEPRLGQGQMALAVGDALGHGGILLAEAGTGVGKTLAYLVPAAISGLKVAVSTGTLTLQEQIVRKDIPILEKLFPGEIRAAIMKGRGNYLCKRRLRGFTQQPLFRDNKEAKFFAAIQSWADETKTGDRAQINGLPDDYSAWQEINSKPELCLGSVCAHFDSCFVTLNRREAALADIVVVNHHLFFADLSVRESSYGEVVPRCDAVIFDEAHMVEETAAGYFGETVSSYKIAEAVRDAERELKSAKLLDKDVLSTLSLLSRRAQVFFDTARGNDGKRRLKAAEAQRLSQHAGELVNTLNLVADFLASMKKAPETMKSLAGRFADTAVSLDGMIRMESEDHVYWVETRGRGVFLQSSPMDVSANLKEKLYPRLQSAVFTSATLTTEGNFSFLRSRLGMAEADEIIVPSPFDYAAQTVFHVAVDMPDPSSPDFTEKAAGRIYELLTLTNGRAFVLFTSHRNMERTWGMLKGKLPYTVLKQGERPKSEILEEFRRDTHSVLFATTSFWQGVDVVGESLSAVIIDKLPFAAPDDPVVEARCEFIEKRGGSPFMEYQVPSAALLLKQGLGRLIRSTKDRGLLAALDRRLVTKSYGRVFLKSLPPFKVRRSMDEVREGLKKMWGE
jgi:ATP-dependent DNA helicase DinG